MFHVGREGNVNTKSASTALTSALTHHIGWERKEKIKTDVLMCVRTVQK